MRQALINENKDLCNENHRYVMRITGATPKAGAAREFIDPEAKYRSLYDLAASLHGRGRPDCD